jgi:transposase
MARAYSTDLRERVVGLIRAGQSCRAAAARFGMSIASAVRWSARERETGSVAALPMGGRKSSRLAERRDWLLARLAENGMTLRRLQAELAERGVRISRSALGVFVERQKWSFPASGPARRRAGPSRRRSAARALARAPGQG